MRPNRGNNKTGWENMEFDALVEEANTINDQEKRYELLNEAEKILIDNMPIIPLYTYVRVINYLQTLRDLIHIFLITIILNLFI